jgi:branched-chain amino acid transport system permease protein
MRRAAAAFVGPFSRRTNVISSTSTLVVFAAAAFLLLPVLDRSQVNVSTTLLLYIAAASAWNIIGGFAGQFSLANSAFIGTGGYATVMILRNLDWGVIPTILVAAALGGLLAVAMGLILFRLRDAYFVVGSMAVALAALTWMINWDVTLGATGISAPIAVIPGREQLFVLALVIAVVAVGAAITVCHSTFGLRLMSVRDDEDVADSLGLSPFRLKLAAVAISGVVTAAVGGVLSLQQITVEPYSMFSLNWSMLFIVMAVVGGMGSVWGPAIGAIVVYYGLVVQLRDLPTFSLLVQGVLLIALMKVLPGGIVGGVARLRAWATTRLAGLGKVG